MQPNSDITVEFDTDPAPLWPTPLPNADEPDLRHPNPCPLHSCQLGLKADDLT